MNASRSAVVVPAYNAAHTIGETLEALQANDAVGRLAKVVLLDDCSTDDTAAAALQSWRSGVPFEVWNNPVNLKERRTTNAAIGRLAQVTEWTFILHADDVVKPHWLSLYFDAMEELPDSVISICSSYDNWWPQSGRVEMGEEFPDRPAVHVTGDRTNVRGTLEKGCWWHLSGCAIRNRAFIEVGGFEPDMPQLGDWEWLLRSLSKGYGIWYLPRSTMLYRQHEGSVSSHSFREARDLREKLKVLALMLSQGFLDADEHNARIRKLLRQLGRRTLVRVARADWQGVMSHSSLLRQTFLGYLAGRV